MNTDKFKELADQSDNNLVKAVKALDPNYLIHLMQEDKYCPYDAVVSLGGKNYLAEVKHRYTKYDTMMLEYKKATSVLDLADSYSNTEPGFMYVNTFEDGTALIWFITRENLKHVKTTSLFAPATTAGDNRCMDKASYLLPCSYATEVKM